MQNERPSSRGIVRRSHESAAARGRGCDTLRRPRERGPEAVAEAAQATAAAPQGNVVILQHTIYDAPNPLLFIHTYSTPPPENYAQNYVQNDVYGRFHS